MENKNLISVEQFCTYYEADFSFIDSLAEHELIETIIIEQKQYLDIEQLKELEKLIHLHYDLDINIEGIDVISNLLKRMTNLQEEVITLKNRLKLYE